jgi:Two component regulator propeller
MKNFKFAIALVCAISLSLTKNSIAEPVTGLKEGKYLQDIKTEVKLPNRAETPVINLFNDHNQSVVVTVNGVFRNLNGTWSGEPFGAGWRTSAIDSRGKIWLATIHSIQKEGDSQQIDLPDYAHNDTITCMSWENDKTLHIGTNHNLLTFTGVWQSHAIAKGKKVTSILTDSTGDLWVATNGGLLRRMNGKWVNLDDDLMAAGLKRSYFALENGFLNGDLLFGGLFAVGCIAKDGNHWLLRGADGLPYGPITTIRSLKNTLWLGTDRGVIKKDKNWHYFNGKRWLADNKVNDILPIDQNTTWIATPKGISQIQQVEMTLAQKAKAFEERIKLRHDRYGLVSGSRLKIQGDLSSSETSTDDNDGLWTAIYLAAESYRYAVTKDPEAKKCAIKAFEAMERLEAITGIPGFPARSLVAENEDTGKGGEWHLTPDKKWKWKGDTSSDEIVGHMFAYPLFYDLVAEGKMKERVRSLVQRIMDHIVDHNFQLVDLDGKATRWAVWTPDSINYSNNWWYERGINSMQILAFLKAALHVTGDQKFEKAYQTLIQKHHYAENMVPQKMYGPFDINHSDDELAFLPNYILLRYANDVKLLPTYLKSTQRSWNVEQPDRIPLWNIISSVALKKDCDLKIALEELQQIPMDLITWRMENSHRWDLPEDQLSDRFGKPQAIRPIPTPERGISKWNTNTYLYNSGNDGYSEDDGAYFLLPYWMGRYHRLFIENEINR